MMTCIERNMNMYTNKVKEHDVSRIYNKTIPVKNRKIQQAAFKAS